MNYELKIKSAMLTGFIISLLLAVIIPFILTRGKTPKRRTTRRPRRPSRPVKPLPWFDPRRRRR